VSSVGSNPSVGTTPSWWNGIHAGLRNLARESVGVRVPPMALSASFNMRKSGRSVISLAAPASNGRLAEWARTRGDDATLRIAHQPG
jgi:hypothetical protein